MKRTWLRSGLVAAMILALCGPARAAGDIAAIRSMAAEQVGIERMRKQTNPDWAAIQARYEVLAPLVRDTDRREGLQYDRDIREALKACAAGDKVKVRQQVLAKGLQHVVVLAIYDEMQRLGNSPEAGRRIAAYFEGIRPTFTRRDKDFFDGRPTLEAAADRAVAQLVGEGGDVPLTARRELTDCIDRTYGLSVLYEIIEVEKLRDTQPSECEVKVKEAEIFYRILQPRIQKQDPQAHRLIAAMLSASHDRMDAGTLEQYLDRGLKGIRLR